jgi:hypothetical protein
MGSSKNNKFIQGIYTPINKQKYLGNGLPSFRSKLERDFFLFFDNNSNVVAWSSESVVIPYYNPVDNKVHQYFVDLLAAIKDNTGTINKYIIEIKPYSQTLPPGPPGKKRSSTILYENLMYNKNQCKWKAAHEWAAKKGMRFVILTEKYLSTQPGL